MQVLKIQQIGNSAGVAFPKEVLERLNLKAGDEIFFTETTGGFFITSYNLDFADAMEAYEITKQQYRNALHQLAQ